MLIKRVELCFEWDVAKNESNINKHGLSFETAALVFNDANRIEIYDIKHSLEEDRYITIGLIQNVVVVIYTMREKNIRIISARLATKQEEKAYYDCGI